jgi:4-diphosphocytidyl-2-C-methyl-D-erythritol kinase
LHPETNTMNEYWLAPAKLNLFLHITGRRPDGYHNLQTLFQLLDWGDELRFSVSDTGIISRSCNIDGIPEAEDICVRAAHLLKTRLGIQKGVHIDLTKLIPMGAGLGGGSSDAATVLLALNQLWSCGLSLQQLADMGLELGADVPVFVHGQSALAEGRGEKLKAAELEQMYYLLVFPGFSISTAEVFNHPSLRRDSSLMDLSQAPLQAGRNDCEPAAFEMYPELKNIMFDLRATGHAHMSGTGSTVFLHFDSKKAAIKAAHNLECRYNVRVVGGVNRSLGMQSKSV